MVGHLSIFFFLDYVLVQSTNERTDTLVPVQTLGNEQNVSLLFRILPSFLFFIFFQNCPTTKWTTVAVDQCEPLLGQTDGSDGLEGVLTANGDDLAYRQWITAHTFSMWTSKDTGCNFLQPQKYLHSVQKSARVVGSSSLERHRQLV